MREIAPLVAGLGLLLALAPAADAQQRFTVDDTTNLGTPFKGQVIIRGTGLEARITIKGVERKQRYTVEIPEDRTVKSIDIVEIAAVTSASNGTLPNGTPTVGATGVLERLGDGPTEAGSGSDDPAPTKTAKTFKDPKNFRLVPILEGSTYTPRIVNADGSDLDPEKEWLVGSEFTVKGALFASSEAETGLNATYRWSVEGKQLASYTVSVGKYKGEEIVFYHGRPDLEDAYSRYRNIVDISRTPLGFGVESVELSAKHLNADALTLFWKTEGAGARKVTLRADVEVNGFKERYETEVAIKVRRSDNPARYIFSCEGKRALPGGLDVLPNHEQWHYNYRGTDKFIFFHREFLRFYNNFRDLFGYLPVMEEFDPAGPAFGEDLANYTYLTETGGTQTSPQHAATKLADFKNISDLGDDLESPFHNRGHGTISRFKSDMGGVRTAPMCEVFFKWHTKVDNVALDYQDLKEAEVLANEVIEEKLAKANTLSPDPDAPEFEDMSGLWRESGKAPDGTSYTAMTAIKKTGHNIYKLFGKGKLETGAGFSYSAQGRRNSETEFEVLHDTKTRGLAGRMLPDVTSVPAIKAKYALSAKKFTGSFSIGDKTGEATYRLADDPAVTFDPPSLILRSGQRGTVKVSVTPPETLDMVWVTDDGFMINGGVKKNRREGAKLIRLEGQAPGEFKLVALLSQGGHELSGITVTVVPDLETDLMARIQQAKASGKTPSVVFDIDDTLFDSRARSQGLLHMYGEANGVDALKSIPLEKIRNDVFRTLNALRYTGTDKGAIKSFHDARWTDGEHYHLDAAYPGALKVAKDAANAGAQIVYLSERPSDQQGATQQQLWANGFPAGNLILMERSMSISRWKAEKLEALAAESTVVGVFDNEPRAVNALAKVAPTGTVFRMDTTMKPQSPDLADGVETLRSFH
jgi:hypothetical protein